MLQTPVTHTNLLALRSPDVSLPSPHPPPAATAVQNPPARVRAARTLSIVSMVLAIVAIPLVRFRLKSQNNGFERGCHDNHPPIIDRVARLDGACCCPS
jgi:hypothetical protein